MHEAIALHQERLLLGLLDVLPDVKATSEAFNRNGKDLLEDADENLIGIGKAQDPPLGLLFVDEVLDSVVGHIFLQDVLVELRSEISQINWDFFDPVELVGGQREGSHFRPLRDDGLFDGDQDKDEFLLAFQDIQVAGRLLHSLHGLGEVLLAVKRIVRLDRPGHYLVVALKVGELEALLHAFVLR